MLNQLLFWGGHLLQVFLVDGEQAPPLLARQVGGSTPLVELDGRSVVLGHNEMHAAAAGLHRSLDNAGHTHTTHL